MNNVKEFSSHSLKDAIYMAAVEFQVDEDKVKYKIITEKTKYFGHKQREIHIEAWISDGNELQALENYLKNFIQQMKVDLSFFVENDKNFAKINFFGNDYRLLLYQNGNLLNAVQYLLNRLFSDNIGKKIFCECENFRKKKERELIGLANRYARDVRKNGKPVNLKEMNPFERRIIHMTINKFSDLESKSDGDNFLKIITIKRKNG